MTRSVDDTTTAGRVPCVSRWKMFGVALVAAVILFGGLTHDGVFVDDAYIGYRFADKIVDGDAFQWNAGGPRIEGFSNPLWTGMSAVFLQLDLRVDTAHYYLALALILLVGIGLFVGMQRRYRFHALAALGLVLLLTTSEAFWISMLNGIETPLQMALLFLVSATLIADQEDLASRHRRLSVLLALLVMNRYEGIAYAGVFGIVYAIRAGSLLAARQRFLPLATALGTFLAASISRIMIFGYVIPLSVAAKSGNLTNMLFGDRSFWPYLHRQLGDGLAYAAGFLEQPTVAALLLLTVTGAFVARRDRLAAAALTVAPPLAVGFSIAMVNGGDWMPGFRLLTPLMPVLAVGAAALWGATNGAESAPSRRLTGSTGPTYGVVAAVVVLIAGVSGLLSTGTPGDLRFDRQYEIETRAIGAYWNSVLDPGEIYVAARGGGLPFGAPDLTFLDFGGLADPCVGRSNLPSATTGKRNWDCTFSNDIWVLDANHDRFAQGVYEAASEHGVEIAVAACSQGRWLSNNWMTTFVNRAHEAEILSRDPNLVVLPFEEWLESDRLAVVSDRCGL